MSCEAVKNIAELCSKFKDLLKDLPDRIKYLRQQQAQYDGATQNILHEIELSEKFSSRSALFIGLRLRELRVKRRAIKDELFILEAINKRLGGKDALIRDLGNFVRIEQSGNAREYMLRE